MPLIEAFKKGGSLNTQSYKDGIHNNKNIPKYANAKCGKKLLKKKQAGGTTPIVHSELVKHLEKTAKKTNLISP